MLITVRIKGLTWSALSALMTSTKTTSVSYNSSSGIRHKMNLSLQFLFHFLRLKLTPSFFLFPDHIILTPGSETFSS